jgi:hypothetical protein
MSAVWMITLWTYVLASLALRTASGRKNPAYLQTSRARWHAATMLLATLFALIKTVELAQTRSLG